MQQIKTLRVFKNTVQCVSNAICGPKYFLNYSTSTPLYGEQKS